jgi:hypothetical protein
MSVSFVVWQQNHGLYRDFTPDVQSHKMNNHDVIDLPER